jgi:hypothetical protein
LLAELPQPQKYPPLHGPVGACSPGEAQKWPGLHGEHSDTCVRFIFAPYVPFGHSRSVP